VNPGSQRLFILTVQATLEELIERADREGMKETADWLRGYLEQTFPPDVTN
jgi:hypothetical protein